MKTKFSKKNETFILDDYIYPKYIDKINLEEIRNRDLQGLDSSYSKNFRESIKAIRKSSRNKKFWYNYIQEFPIVITDTIRWRKILIEFGITDRKYFHRRYFKLDYFFPTTGIAVEIDSSLHNRIYDKARDLYIKETFGIETIRFEENQQDLELLKQRSNEIIKDKISSGFSEESKITLDFFQEQLDTKTILFRDIEIGYENFYISDEIILEKNYYCNKYSDPDVYDIFIKEFEDSFYEQYHKTIKWI